jgi:hypothetical protein
MLSRVVKGHREAKTHVIEGNLVSREDCERITGQVPIIYHLAAGREEKFNSVVATRNLLDSVVENWALRDFADVSSFLRKLQQKIGQGGLLDETCDVVREPKKRRDTDGHAKVRQDELLVDYHGTLDTGGEVDYPRVGLEFHLDSGK